MTREHPRHRTYRHLADISEWITGRRVAGRKLIGVAAHDICHGRIRIEGMSTSALAGLAFE
jgi:hypothetical protein